MAKLNYQQLSRESMLKDKPMVGPTHDSRRLVYDNSPVKLNGPDYVLKFGKFKGTMLKDIPIDYVMWAILNLDSSRVDMFIRELQRRDSSFII
jgi:hypothetical protein